MKYKFLLEQTTHQTLEKEIEAATFEDAREKAEAMLYDQTLAEDFADQNEADVENRIGDSLCQNCGQMSDMQALCNKCANAK